MKVLVINGSPRGEQSNSLKLTEAFIKGLGNAEIVIHHLARSEIQSCKGCFACWNVTPGTCVIRDDAGGILKDLLRADVIIWSFPLYYYSVPGLLKNLIDRQLPLTLPFMAEREDGVGNGSHPSRYDRDWQRHVLISTCGFHTSEGNYDAVCRMFDHMCGKDGYTALLCGQGELFSVPQLKNTTEHYLRLVERAGAEYLHGQIAAGTKEELARPLFPQAVFEEMADASWGITKAGEKENRHVSPGHTLVKQMAALYRIDSYPGADRILEFAFTDLKETYQIILGKTGSAVLTSEFRPFTTRIETPFTVWSKIASGGISGTEALMERQYRVAGSFEIMLEWDEIFYGGAETEDKAAAAKPTKMSILLLPWMLIWIILSIDAVAGGIAGVTVCALLPFMWIRYEATIYEYLTILSVSVLSLAAIMQADVIFLLPVSYGLFGLMWFGSVFTRVPLTANYSKNGYGGSRALQNVMFMRTNRILTACWGILYLLTPIWTLMIMKSDASPYIGAINSVLPVLMGLFTAWFQKWYPRQIAGGRKPAAGI